MLFIRRLSSEWVAQSALAEEETCPEPVRGVEIPIEERLAVADSLRESMRALAKE
jgi:hypothetical protein